MLSPAGQKTLAKFGFLPVPRTDMTRRRRGVPLVAVLLASVAVAFFVLPLVGLLQRAPWSDAWDDLTSPAALDAMRLSLECSLWATALSIVFGVPLAYTLARGRFPGRSLVRAFVVLPMVLPPVVGGVALLYAFSVNNGLVGGWLHDTFDLQLTFSKPGRCSPRPSSPCRSSSSPSRRGCGSMDRRYEDAAASLGAGRWTVFRRVTLPLIAPSLWAGAALAWARALGEFGATITFAGNIQGRTQTMPLAVYLLLEAQQGTAIMLSLVLLLVSIVVLVLLRDRWFGAVRES